MRRAFGGGSSSRKVPPAASAPALDTGKWQAVFEEYKDPAEADEKDHISNQLNDLVSAVDPSYSLDADSCENPGGVWSSTPPLSLLLVSSMCSAKSSWLNAALMLHPLSTLP